MLRLALLLALLTSALGLLVVAAGWATAWKERQSLALWGFVWGALSVLPPILSCAAHRGLPGSIGALFPDFVSPAAFLAGGFGFPALLAWNREHPWRRWLYAQLILVPGVVPVAVAYVASALCTFT